MKLSKTTLELLKNYATINTNLLVKSGSSLSTVSASKSILAKGTIEESFPQEFAIYDLNQFLSLVTMSDDTEIEFSDEYLTCKSGAGRFKFYYAEPSIIVAAPDKEIELDNFYQFNITKEQLNTIYRAASVISAPTLSVVSNTGGVTMSVGDPNTPKSNSFTTDIGQANVQFDARLSIENLKVIADDYEVTVSQKKAFKFSNSKRTYFLALEPSSNI
jgi:hypothetical protein